MTNINDFRKDPQHTLWEELDGVRAGMLGLVGSGDHMQPMTHFVDRAASKLYFITSDQTDLAKQAGVTSTAHYCVASTDQDFYACLSGVLKPITDKAKLDELWSKVVAAWFPDGKEDKHITLLEFSLGEAALWASTGNPLIFGLEIAKANLNKDKTPDVGEHRVVTFAKAA